MEKCKYCYMLPNGDFPDDTPEICKIDKNISLKLSKKIDNFEVNGSFNINVNTIADFCGNGVLWVNTEIFDCDKNEMIVDSIFDEEATFPFNYCPMCGRKLR